MPTYRYSPRVQARLAELHREERLLRIEERSMRRIKRRRVLRAIARGFNDSDAEARYAALVAEADNLARRAWQARVEAGTRRWAADDAAQVLRVVK